MSNNFENPSRQGLSTSPNPKKMMATTSSGMRAANKGKNDLLNEMTFVNDKKLLYLQRS